MARPSESVTGGPAPRTGERVVTVVHAAGSEPVSGDVIVAVGRAHRLAWCKSSEQVDVVDQLPRNVEGVADAELRSRRFESTGGRR